MQIFYLLLPKLDPAGCALGPLRAVGTAGNSIDVGQGGLDAIGHYFTKSVALLVILSAFLGAAVTHDMHPHI
jgi:hypothetical protein